MESEAQGVYSAREQIYLKSITPVLYEFSQVASDVSASVLKLQSSPPEECASQFADYRGIVAALSGQLAFLTPPERLETVHGFAIEAMEGYSKGLGLYFDACTEEDYGVKESLVSQGGVYLNKSVTDVGKAYEEIEVLKSAGLPPAREETAERITEGELTEGTDMSGAAAGTGREYPPVSSAPAQQPKSKEQVLAEISEKVQAEMEAKETAEENTQAELVEGPSEPLVVTREEKHVPPVKEETETVVEETKTIVSEKTEAPEIAAPEPEPVMPTDAPSKMESADEPPPGAAKTGREDADTEAGKEEEIMEPADEEPAKDKKDKIEKLNRKIMEQAQDVQIDGATDESAPPDTGTWVVQPSDETEGAATETTDTAGQDVPAEGKADQEVALVPPGGTAEELKEEEVPVDEIRSWCEGRYQVKTEQEECMRKRAVAKDKIEKLSNKYSGGSPEKEVLDKCMSDWKEGGTYNYDMVISCTQFFCTQRGIEDCKDLGK